MLSRHNRLNLRARPNFFDQAEKIYTDLFTIYYQLQPQEKQTKERADDNIKDENIKNDQAVVIARKKDFKQAVQRHRIVRKIRAALRPLLARRGIELAVIAKKPAKNVKVEKIKEELEKFFKLAMEKNHE